MRKACVRDARAVEHDAVNAPEVLHVLKVRIRDASFLQVKPNVFTGLLVSEEPPADRFEPLPSGLVLPSGGRFLVRIAQFGTAVATLLGPPIRRGHPYDP